MLLLIPLVSNLFVGILYRPTVGKPGTVVSLTSVQVSNILQCELRNANSLATLNCIYLAFSISYFEV